MVQQIVLAQGSQCVGGGGVELKRIQLFAVTEQDMPHRREHALRQAEIRPADALPAGGAHQTAVLNQERDAVGKLHRAAHAALKQIGCEAQNGRETQLKRRLDDLNRPLLLIQRIQRAQEHRQQFTAFGVLVGGDGRQLREITAQRVLFDIRCDRPERHLYRRII